MVTPASWLAPPECVMLSNYEVHVWRASLEMTSSQVKTMEHILSADELGSSAESVGCPDAETSVSS